MAPDPSHIWQELHQALTAFVRRRVPAPDAAADIVQEVFLKVQLHLPQLRDSEKVTPWVFQIARHAVADYHRQRQRDLGAEVAEPLAESESRDLTAEFSACVRPMIAGLPEPYREALWLSEIEGLPQTELATRLGLSYSGAKSRVQRGRQLLKARILACCEVSADAYGNIMAFHPRRKP